MLIPETQTLNCVQAPPEVIAAYTAVMAEKQAGKDATADAGVAGDATASGLPDGLKVRGDKMRCECCVQPIPDRLCFEPTLPAECHEWKVALAEEGGSCCSVHAPRNIVCHMKRCQIACHFFMFSAFQHAIGSVPRC